MGDSTPMEGLQVIPREVEDQTLCMFPFFKNSHLVRDPFRTFHRGDGFLLTMSPMSGVNYLDKEFPQYLAEPVDTVFDNEDISAVGLCFKAFAEHGTSTWHRRTVEWFLIYLLTELGITPHPMRQGYNAPELNSAYSAVIQGTYLLKLMKMPKTGCGNLSQSYASTIVPYSFPLHSLVV